MSKAKKIADMAIFIAIGVILNIVSFPLFEYFGRMSLVYLHAYLVGCFFGPWVGAAVAAAADIVPALLLPQGPWMPVITLSVAMIAVVVGVSNKYLPFSFGFRLAIGVLGAYAVSTLILTPLGEMPLYHIFPYAGAKALAKTLGIESAFLSLMVYKGVTQPVWILFNTGVAYLICARLKALLSKRYGFEFSAKARDKELLLPQTVPHLQDKTV